MRIEKHITLSHYWEVGMQDEGMWKGISTHESEQEALVQAKDMRKEGEKISLWKVSSHIEREMVPF